VLAELPLSGGAYGAQIPRASRADNFNAVAVDANGDLFVADYTNNAIEEMALSGGVYAPAVTVASGFNGPLGIAVDRSGRLYVLDIENIWRLTP
jgi:sugar lactone lactonase YvrE